MDVGRAAALVGRASPPWDRNPGSSDWIRDVTGASAGLLRCAECGADVVLEIPVIAAAPANPDRLPAATYRCVGCARTSAPVSAVVGQVQVVVERRWRDAVWLAGWCSTEIDRANDALAERQAFFAWLVSAPRKNMRALVRATRDLLPLGIRRSRIKSALERMGREIAELEGRRAALGDLQANQRRRAGGRPSVREWWQPKPTRIVWEVEVLADRWSDSPSARVEKRWTVVRSTLGGDWLQLTADGRILLVAA
jgi:hypothetical protein